MRNVKNISHYLIRPHFVLAMALFFSMLVLSGFVDSTQHKTKQAVHTAGSKSAKSQSRSTISYKRASVQYTKADLPLIGHTVEHEKFLLVFQQLLNEKLDLVTKKTFTFTVNHKKSHLKTIPNSSDTDFPHSA